MYFNRKFERATQTFSPTEFIPLCEYKMMCSDHRMLVNYVEKLEHFFEYVEDLDELFLLALMMV